MTLKSSRHGGDVFGFSPEERNKILDFSININPLGLSPAGRKALTRYWEVETLRYPDVEERDVKEALSKAYGMDKDTISLGNGATELMYTLLRITKPARVLVPAPAFSEYRLSAEAAGAKVVSFLLPVEDHFNLPLREIKEKMGSHSLIYLGNPNNPDGRLLHREEFQCIMDRAQETESLVVIDESFIDFAGDACSYRQECRKYPNLVVMMSLTKFYAVPGLRIGCSFADPKMAGKLNDALIPWNVNGPAQLYMTEAAGDRDYIHRSRAFVKTEREWLAGELKTLPGLTVYPSTINFLLLRITGKGKDAGDLQKLLLPEDIFIRQCGNYEGLDNSFFRLAVRTHEENERLLRSLRKVWKE